MYDVHVYPIFRVKVKNLLGEPVDVAYAAEMAVAEALNDSTWDNRTVEVTGQGFCTIEFADGFDASLIDVMAGKRVMRSFTQSDHHNQALEHASTLEDLIDGEKDAQLAKLLGPIKSFLETVR